MNREVIKEKIKSIDEKLGTSFFKTGKSIEKGWYKNSFLTGIRRILDPILIWVKYNIITRRQNSLKLHLGCGNQHFEGYINIDCIRTRAADYICDIRKLPFPENSVSLIECYHVIEHLPRKDLLKTFQGFYKVFKPGGRLIIECPDFDKAVKEYLGGNEKRLNDIFGQQRDSLGFHYFGYNFKRLKNVLEKVGFKKIIQKEAQAHHVKKTPCLRVECIK